MTTEVYRIEDPFCLTESDMFALHRAGEIIRSGGLVVFPTETVYGLGASAYDPGAARAVYAAKGRPSDNPLIVHVSSPDDAADFAEVNDTYLRTADCFMPGPITVILKKTDMIPREITGGLDTVAVRCPSHPVASELIKKAGVPIAAPSANLSGRPSPTRAEHAFADLFGRVNMIIDGGDSDVGLESTVVLPESDGSVRILRPGAVTAEMLAGAGFSVFNDGAVLDLSLVGKEPLSPGMKYRHYSPDAEVILVDMSKTSRSFAEVVAEMEQNRCGIYAVMCRAGTEMDFAADILFSYFDETDMAHKLFACLREADRAEAERIYVPLPPKSGVGLAVFNRVIRAAGGKITVPE